MPARPAPHLSQHVGIAVTTFALLAAAGAGLATAHSWYPRSCCSDQDCMKVDKIDYVSGGMFMSVGSLRLFVPETMVKQPSQDGDAHICLVLAPNGIYGIRCVFLPGNA